MNFKSLPLRREWKTILYECNVAWIHELTWGQQEYTQGHSSSHTLHGLCASVWFRTLYVTSEKKGKQNLSKRSIELSFSVGLYIILPGNLALPVQRVTLFYWSSRYYISHKKIGIELSSLFSITFCHVIMAFCAPYGWRKRAVETRAFTIELNSIQ